jgi:ATP-dependent Clp protease protease subunit
MTNHPLSEKIENINKEEYISSIHDKWIDIASREIWIHGVEGFDGEEEPGIDYRMATRVIKNLHILKNISRKEPITIHLHSCGGIVEEGLAIYDAIRLMPYHVTMIVYTHARSMSSYVLQAADERIMLPSSHFMFHAGSLAVSGNPQAVKSNVDFCEKVDSGLLMSIYVDALKKKGKHKSKSRKEISKMLQDLMDKKGDVFLSAKETVKWGFADKILRKF